MEVKILLLAGGRSTRMGSDKALLVPPWSDDRSPLFVHILRILQEGFPESINSYVSIRKDQLSSYKSQNPDLKIDYIFDTIPKVDQSESGGPAIGLLAAYESDPTATWLVCACDYPLIASEAVVQLREGFIPPLTCFRNEDGFIEPLLGIWTPAALKELRKNFESGKQSPSFLVDQVNGRTLTPTKYDWVKDVNNAAEWKNLKG